MNLSVIVFSIIIYIVIGYMSKIYRNKTIYRPVEEAAFRNIEKEYRIKQDWGERINFTDFETRVYFIDLNLRTNIIPIAEKFNKTKPIKFVKVPIPSHEIAILTNHTPDYIQKILDNINDKVWLRERLNIKPILPEIKKIKV